MPTIPAAATPASAAALDRLTGLFADGNVLVLTGAGVSTDSGIPDYRGPDGTAHNAAPMTFQRFIGSETDRRRYWARSHVGWARFAAAQPNPCHLAVAALGRQGRLTGVVTQNVDGLHSAAGSPQVIDLHGRLDRVTCLTCGVRRPRLEVGLRLDAVNPGYRHHVAAAAGTLRPDGDIALDDTDGFRLVACRTCGGVLKPDVVYFGEHVPRERFRTALAWLDRSRSLVVLGSSLMVGSGYRFATAAARRGLPIAIVTRGVTRADHLASLRLDAPLAEVLPPLAASLAPDHDTRPPTTTPDPRGPDMHDARTDVTSSLTRLTAPRPLREQLASDVRSGLTGPERSLPPIYLYDPDGSDLFEQITELDEYYPTRTERAILEQHAGDLVRAIQPDELLELGSGSSAKTDLLLAAMRDAGGDRYVALEISEAALAPAIDRLRRRHPGLVADGYVGDFHHDLPAIERSGRRLVTFLGSTIGNLTPADREVLLKQIACVLEPDDGVLLGIDLVKDPGVLVPAYDDASGVTAAFNRNVLAVINRELDGDIPVAAFAHRAVWNADDERIEMHLVATRSLDAHLSAIDLDLRFERDEHIVTEHSHKFRIEPFSEELAAAGLDVQQVATDDRGWFAEVLATPAATER